MDVRVVDSHTEGEPTRVVLAGAPDLGPGDAAARRRVLAERFDAFRSAVVCEPRGFDAMVGALLLEPRGDALAAVVFFNNVGTLGMCVHGTIGVAETLHHLGRLPAGRSKLETPVGEVWIERARDGRVSVENVPAWRHARGVQVRTARHGLLAGDVAWGGNWFYLVDRDGPLGHGRELAHAEVRALSELTLDVLASLAREGITGADGAPIDHVELFAPPARTDAHSRNFVMCPGGQYDRSPCGTGTSAKLACLAEDGKLADGDAWRQESILGTLFEGRVRRAARGVVPTITGRAWITAESTLRFADDDPLREGLRP
jgi:4-hydroxyproline epimerase